MFTCTCIIIINITDSNSTSASTSTATMYYNSAESKNRRILCVATHRPNNIDDEDETRFSKIETDKPTVEDDSVEVNPSGCERDRDGHSENNNVSVSIF